MGKEETYCKIGTGTRSPGRYSRERKKPSAGQGQDQEPLAGIVGKGRHLLHDMAGTRAPGRYSRERKKLTNEDKDRNKSP